MTFSTIVYEKDGGIGWVRLNRPQARNAYNVRMRDELFEVLGAVRDDREVRVLVFSGEGQAFCVGGDVTEFGTMPPPIFAREIRWQRDVWGALRALPCPTIAAMHGYAVGSGLELALYCDFRLAADDLVIAVPEILLGMIPPAGGTQTLGRTAGQGVALDMLLTARRLNATEALRWRLVQRVVPRTELLSSARALALKLARRDPLLLQLAKEALWAALDLPLHEGLALEWRLAQRAARR
jgi:enoyl-CoA hydratase/carnithine racemase